VTVDTHNGQRLTTQANDSDVTSIYFSFSRKRLKEDLGLVGITSVPVPIKAI
jgi:hypothetical protein